MINQNKIEEIVSWLREVYRDKPGVIAVSGGVDSALSLTLLTRALGKERVTPVCLPYQAQDMIDAKKIIERNGLSDKMIEINIGEMVEVVAGNLGIDGGVRKGNVMARMRMISVFDIAKKMGALVCGTENKSEHYLGYFTRFGDAASDVEPIAGLYKTEVWEMAKMLGLPEIFYTKEPSAGLWEGQTDEGEMGFSYKDADQVLKGEIEGIDPTIVAKVQKMVAKNKFKLEVPYVMD
jgi:NAD+ synthase